MSRLSVALICGGLMATSAPAFAQDQVLGDPASQLNQLDYFVGTWTCTGQSTDPNGVTSPSDGTLTVERAYADHWFSHEWQPKDQSKPAGVVYQGYDSGSKKFVQLGVSSCGGYGGGGTSGWEQSNLTWAGEIATGTGHSFKFKETITKTSDTDFSRKFEVAEGLIGGWKVANLSTCTKN